MHRPVFVLCSAALGAAALFVNLGTMAGCGDATFDTAPAANAGPGDSAAEDGACSADLTTDSLNCGACGNACADGQMCGAGKCIVGCQGSTIYVSKAGDDAKSGCSPSTAKNTIGSAIAAAKMNQFKGYEIHVCAGPYASAVVLDYPISLRGAYDCATWKQTATYGYPSFDGANLTTISALGGAMAGVSLTVDDAAIGNTQVIDGFSIVGPNITSARSTAVHIVSGSPTLSNNAIAGGSGMAIDGDPQNSAGSTGLWISAGAPTIIKNQILGGTGVAVGATRGSIGLYADPTAGAAVIQNNVINGGAGSAANQPPTVASVGLLLQGGPYTGATALSGNLISGGSGKGTGSTSQIGIFGVEVQGATLSLVGNYITGGTASCATCTETTVAAVYAPTTSGISLVANRIYGGDVDAATASNSTILGIYVTAASTVFIADNMIHAGNELQIPNHPGFSVGGIRLANGDQAVVEHNTIAMGMTAGRALDLESGETHAAVQYNLFAGAVDTTANDHAVFVLSCGAAPRPIAAFEHNAIAGFSGATLYVASGGSPCTAGSYTTAKGAEAELFSEGATASGNFVALGVSCGAEPATACQYFPACDLTNLSIVNHYQACMTAFFTAWDPSTVGTATLSAGWHLNTTMPCAVLRPIAPSALQIPLATDAFAVPFGPRATMGAEEQAAACP